MLDRDGRELLPGSRVLVLTGDLMGADATVLRELDANRYLIRLDSPGGVEDPDLALLGQVLEASFCKLNAAHHDPFAVPGRILSCVATPPPL